MWGHGAHRFAPLSLLLFVSGCSLIDDSGDCGGMGLDCERPDGSYGPRGAGGTSGSGGKAGSSASSGGGASGGAGAPSLDCDGTCEKLFEKANTLSSELGCGPNPEPKSKCVDSCKSAPAACTDAVAGYFDCLTAAATSDFVCDVAQGGVALKEGVCQAELDATGACATGM